MYNETLEPKATSHLEPTTFRVIVSDPIAIDEEEVAKVMKQVREQILKHCVQIDPYTRTVTLLLGDHYDQVIESKGGKPKTLYHHNTSWKDDPCRSSRLYINLTMLQQAVREGHTDMNTIKAHFESVDDY